MLEKKTREEGESASIFHIVKSDQGVCRVVAGCCFQFEFAFAIQCGARVCTNEVKMGFK